ncbi:MAG: hypothetical protein MUO23_07115 [Anaerolineales bacterium]|nr:hypothetical protein [Anaerolineales bacterium]
MCSRHFHVLLVILAVGMSTIACQTASRWLPEAPRPTATLDPAAGRPGVLSG